MFKRSSVFKDLTCSICFARSKCKVQTAIKHASDITGACPRKVWSITPEGLEHNSGRSGALLLKYWSIALEGLEHCSWRLGALLLEAGGIALGIQKHAFLGCESMSFRGSKARLLGHQGI